MVLNELQDLVLSDHFKNVEVSMSASSIAPTISIVLLSIALAACGTEEPSTSHNVNGDRLDVGREDVSDVEAGDVDADGQETEDVDDSEDVRDTSEDIQDVQDVSEDVHDADDVEDEPDCDGRQPAAMIRTPTCHVNSPGTDCLHYDSLYGADFPGTAQARQIFTNRDEYISLEFTVGDLPSSSQGGWAYVVPQLTPTQTGRNIQSISKCPGDFDQDRIQQEMGDNCYMRQSGFDHSVRWAMVEGDSTSRCLLTPGETYYYNILYTSSPAGTAPEDLQWQCGAEPEWDVCSNNTEAIF